MSVSYAALRAEQPQAFTADCPTRVVLDHVMGKWGVLVLAELTGGTRRWGELRRAVDRISEKMLASTLRTLVADGLVRRTSLPSVPPHVEYDLTPLGEELMERVLPLLAWVAVHAEQIVGD